MLMLWLSIFTSLLIVILTFSFIIVNSNYISNGLISNLKTSIWGCENSFEIIHCDLSKNAIEGTETTQKSTLINNITREPFYVDGKFGKAIEFIDKYAEYVEIPKKDIYNTPQFSISFWVKKTNGTDQLNTHAHIISFTSFDNKNGWSFDTNSSHDQSIRFIISNKNGNVTTSNSISISNSTFTHVVATFDGSHIGVFKNGNLYEMIAYHGNYSSAHNIPIHIGSASYCDSCLQFKGIVDDVRLYDRAISLNEVKQLYLLDNNNLFNSNDKNFSKGLIGHWTFDNTLNDSSLIKMPGQMFTLMTSMVSASDGRIFISEKNTGKIVVMKNEKILDKPFAVINDSYINWEQGLLGLAIDPYFEENHFVYLYYTAINSDDNPINRVIRFTDKENVGINPTIILDNIPASYGYHSGGAMAFGPDDKLYITVGDATEHLYSQSKSVLLGKILRINSDGSIPKDNPFPDSPIYTLGHRNMFGIAFDYKDKIGIVTENGDILYDKINLIEKGGNYGFPTLQPANINPQLSNSSIDIKPLRTFWHTIAPTQTIYYTGDRFPYLKNTFLFGTFTGNIYDVHIDNYTQTIDSEQHIRLYHSPFEPTVGITQSVNGEIYYGSFHIYKLDKVFENKTIQILFPIQFDYPTNIVLDNVQTKIGKYVIVDLHYIDKNISADNTSKYLKIKLPTSLINGIENVNASITSSKDETIQKIIPFSLDNKSLKYNHITIPISFNGNKIQIMINANISTSGYR